jgi:hypothetical protein
VNPIGEAAHGAEQLGLFKPVEKFLDVARSGSPKVQAVSPKMLALSDRILEEGHDLIGKLRWRGNSGPDPRAGWRISEINNRGHFNDFARWINGTGPELGRDSTCNCYEALFVIAHRAHAVDKQTLDRLHMKATAAAQTTYRAEGDELAAKLAYWKVIEDYLVPGERTKFTIDPATGVGGPDIPAGHVVIIDGMEHVMLSLGTRDTLGRNMVLSHADYPEYSPAGPTTSKTFGFLQKTSVEEIVSAVKVRYPIDTSRIESALPTWLIGNSRAMT